MGLCGKLVDIGMRIGRYVKKGLLWQFGQRGG